MRRAYRLITLVLAVGACSACAAANHGGSPRPAATPAPEDPGALAADLAETRPLGPGPAYRPEPIGNPNVQSGTPVGPLRCRSASGGVYGAHIELFARDRGVQVPAGIGISHGQSRGPFVAGGHCRYPLTTTDPTGVIQVQPRAARGIPTLRALFALWGQPLSRTRLVSFVGSVRAFLGGRPWRQDPRSIPLRRHSQIVLEVGSPVRPHASYLFPAGL